VLAATAGAAPPDTAASPAPAAPAAPAWRNRRLDAMCRFMVVSSRRRTKRSAAAH
jgi:hypothetical protein